MLERSEYPPGVPCWIDTAQPDPEAATRFYGGLFGWEFEDQMPSDAPGNYFMARLHGRDEGQPPEQEGSLIGGVGSHGDDDACRRPLPAIHLRNLDSYRSRGDVEDFCD